MNFISFRGSCNGPAILVVNICGVILVNKCMEIEE